MRLLGLTRTTTHYASRSSPRLLCIPLTLFPIRFTAGNAAAHRATVSQVDGRNICPVLALSIPAAAAAAAAAASAAALDCEDLAFMLTMGGDEGFDLGGQDSASICSSSSSGSACKEWAARVHDSICCF
jgi:hypothetical protein